MVSRHREQARSHNGLHELNKFDQVSLLQLNQYPRLIVIYSELARDYLNVTENHTMSTDGALSRSRLLPSLLGILLLLMGLAMLAGGIKLSMLGGSLYYLLAGIGFALSGVLLIAARRAALGLYAVVLFASTVWALWEVGL